MRFTCRSSKVYNWPTDHNLGTRNEQAPQTTLWNKIDSKASVISIAQNLSLAITLPFYSLTFSTSRSEPLSFTLAGEKHSLWL